MSLVVDPRMLIISNQTELSRVLNQCKNICIAGRFPTLLANALNIEYWQAHRVIKELEKLKIISTKVKAFDLIADKYIAVDREKLGAYTSNILK